jgi:hypothetical protein
MHDKYFDLIQKSIKCIESYDPKIDSVDTHFDEYVNKKKLKDLNEIIFIK